MLLEPLRETDFIQIHSQNFIRDSLEAVSDSKYAVKTKNAPNFMNFPNMYTNYGNFFSESTGPLKVNAAFRFNTRIPEP
jgi:hypothetical protein